MGIIVAILFILLLVSFYFIILLNMKINRFQKQDYSQGVQFEEMEASIASFLTEIEDENTKLIASLKKEMKNLQSKDANQPQQAVAPKIISKSIKEQELVKEVNNEEPEVKVAYSAPKAYVQNAYHAQKKEQPVQTVEQRVHDMYVRGMSTEKIAKELGKGKTEVELLLKFNNKTLK